MAIIKRSELRGILILALVILIIGGLLAVSSGKLETWFGIAIGGGPKLFDKIVYVSGDELYVVNPDGSEARQLTTGGQVQGEPSVSPNGIRVVFVGRVGSSNQVMFVRGSGGKPIVLTGVTGGKRLPCYSPDGKSLAFVAGGTVYVGDQDGGNLQPTLPTPKETRLSMIRRDPLPAYRIYAWSGKGTGMAAVQQNAPSGEALVYLSKIGGEARRFDMPNDRVSVNGIASSGEGRLLAATAVVGNESVAAIFDIGKKSAQAIAVSKTEVYRSVAFSPDGSQVAFAAHSTDKNGLNGIVLRNINTGQGGILAGGTFDSLSFSPDGDKLLAVSIGEGETRDVVIIDVEDGQVTQITSDGRGFDPVWSPANPR